MGQSRSIKNKFKLKNTTHLDVFENFNFFNQRHSDYLLELRIFPQSVEYHSCNYQILSECGLP